MLICSSLLWKKPNQNENYRSKVLIHVYIVGIAYHKQTDKLAVQASNSNRASIDPLKQMVYFTNAPASGWVWPCP